MRERTHSVKEAIVSKTSSLVFFLFGGGQGVVLFFVSE